MIKEKYAFQMQNINKSYQDGMELQSVLENLNLQVGYGELIAVVGPSGSGKSTFLTIAGGLLSPDSGSVMINGKEISGLSQKQLTDIRREKIGFIFQNHQLLPYLTVEEQLKLVQKMNKSENKDEINELITDVGLEKCKKRYPNQLSGGERQRIAIARAFINHPDLILADEPTASLDGQRGYQIVEMIRNEIKKYNRAGIIVTHDERVLNLVDKIYFLENKTLKMNS